MPSALGRATKGFGQVVPRAAIAACAVLLINGCGPQRAPSFPTSATGTDASSPAPADDAKVDAMVTVQSEPYGEMPDGRVVMQYLLANEGGVRVTLIDLGATVTSVEVPDRNGERANITLGFDSLAGYLENQPYFGVICGRFANRIANGKFTLDGQEYTVAVNSAPHHLHGGVEGFGKKLWKSEPIDSDTSPGVRFTYVSPAGEEGFPGELSTTVVYTLNAQNELSIDYTATTTAPTVLNLTNHCYWNLSGSGQNTIHDHELTLFASRYVPIDETAIPTGELANVAGTPMDFLTPHTMGERIDQTVNGAGGYDHCYVVDGEAGTLRRAAKVTHPASGRVMEISTTEPGLQLYTGNHLKGTPTTGGAVKHGAFCLEAQHYPDSPNHPEFPTTTLRPGETYRQTTVHKFQ